MTSRKALLIAMLGLVALSACRREGEIVIEQGVGITALRSVCSAVGVPEFTGDITLFSPASARSADAIDVVAAMTNVRSTCTETGADVYTEATFDVLATRTDTRGARTVELPYYSTIVRGNNAVVAKRIGMVTVNFADGQARAQGSGTAGAFVNRSAATLPEDIRLRITARRRAGEQAAAVDPLTEPDVREAVARATFELLIGFQLSEDQLAYNATR